MSVKSAGSLVIEEDDMGDAMYVVLSGQCEVRARPTQNAISPSLPVEQAPAIAMPLRSDSGSSDSDGDIEKDSAQAPSSTPATARRSEAEHTATYWIHKYMEQVGIIASSTLLQIS